MEILKFNFSHESYVLFVTPGKSVEVHTVKNDRVVDVRAFKVGDTAEYDSYNLHYTAPIKAITAKNVIFDLGDRFGRKETKRLKMEVFAWRNHDFDLEYIQERNSETMQCI